MVGAACTIAHSPFFNVMVFTTQIVKHRIYVSKKNVDALEKLRTHKSANAFLFVVNSTSYTQRMLVLSELIQFYEIYFYFVDLRKKQ